MKKLWEVEQVGQYHVIVCDVEFESGRCGGAARKIQRTEWSFAAAETQRAILEYHIQNMNDDIGHLAQKHGEA